MQRLIILAAIMAFGTTAAVHAQEYRGRVQGTIYDTSQAAVAGATVVLKNSNTGFTESRITGETGHYVFDLVQPGSYSVRAEAAGFSSALQENVAIQTRADVTVDLVLKVGAVSEVLTVQESPVVVPMNTSKLEVVVDNALVNSVPTLSRNVYLMAQFEPSVEKPRGYTENNPWETYAAGGSTVAGGAPYTTEIQIDGAAIATSQKVGYTPPQDAVQEVTLQQNSVDTESGYSSGSSLTVALKSGTNEFHGSGYYQAQRPELDALENRVSRSENRGSNNVYAFSLGHPIVKNKLFNFVAYEQWDQVTPGERIYTMPTADEIAGDFSKSLNKNGALRTIYDPLTTVVNADGTSTRTPFPGNKIPADRISSVAKAWASQLWQPNQQGYGPDRRDNYLVSTPLQYHYKNFLDRADYYVTDKLRVFGRYSRLTAPGTGGNPTNTPLWVDSDGSMNRGATYSANGVYTLNERTVVNVTWERHSMDDDANYFGETGEAQWAKIWPNSKWYAPLFTQPGQKIYHPRIQLNGSSGANFIAGTSDYIWQKDATGSSFGVKVAHDRGRHYLKAGGDTRLISGLATNGGLPGFSFNNNPTVADYLHPDSLSGDPMATMLLGVVAPGGGARTSFPINALQNPSSRSYSGYLQDDIKVNSRLTLNLGLRYEWEQPYVEANNKFSLGPDLNAPLPALQAVMPAMPDAVKQYYTGTWSPNGAWRFTDSNHRTQWHSNNGSLMPRVGAVIRLNDKTSVRAAWARFAIPWQVTKDYYRGETDFFGSPVPGFSENTTAPDLVNGVPQMSLDNPFPAGYPLRTPVGKARGIYSTVGSDVYFYTQDRTKPYSDRLNVSFARQLPKNVVFEATFFYNRSHDTDELGARYWDLNAVDPRLAYKYGSAVYRSIPNPFYQLLSADQFPGSLRDQRYVSAQSLMKPYPQYGQILEGQRPGSGDSYKSGQVRVQKAFSNGFSVLAGYNYHFARQTEYYDDIATYLHQLTWQDSFMPRHRVNITATWDLPVGQGRRFLSSASRAVDLLVGGWRLSEVMSWRSGFFLRFDRMQVKGNPIVSNPTPARWFDTSVFSRLDPYTPRTNPLQYAGLTGPGQRDFDARLAKSIRVTERIHADLIMDALNVLNGFTPAMPSTDVDSSNFGKITRQQRYTFGRRIQPSLRITF